MTTARFAIVGGGLSGLHAAYELERRGVTDYVLLEASSTFGGRIHSAAYTTPADNDSDRFDLGATWFWPSLQPELDRLVRDLGLTTFEQFESGDLLDERSANRTPSRLHGYTAAPSAMRLESGMQSLIDALRKRVASDRLVSHQVVKRIRLDPGHIHLEASDARGNNMSYRAQAVLLSVPPRLAMSSIEFSPGLPDPVSSAWRQTATWMAPHAKYLAIYDTPFWRPEGLSGEARSSVGPLGEIHDASACSGRGALFGFFGIPAHVRRRIADDVMKQFCRAQMVRLFGAKAAEPVGEVIKDWAQSAYTATTADLDELPVHSTAPPSQVASGTWHGRLIGIASEWSKQYPGYLAGAIEASSLGVTSAIQHAVSVAARRGHSSRR